MFGFNKKKHGRSNLRIKRDDDDDAPVESAANQRAKPKKAKVKKSDKTPKESKEAAKMTKLSFDDDINTTVDFKVKKSSISRKLAREREREKSKKIKSEPPGEDPTKYKEISTYTAIDDDDLDGIPDDGDSEDAPNYKPVSQRGQRSAIPDAYAIHSARKKREMARKHNQSELDQIPLNQDKVYKPNNSRFIREDDDSYEERIDMRVHTEEYENETIHMEEEKDEEFLKWEQAQMKKGASITTGTDITHPKGHNYIEKPNQKMSTNEYIPKVVLPEISIDVISNEIRGEVKSLKELLAENEHDLQSTVNALETSEANVTKCEIKIAELSRSFEFFQETKCFINDYSKLLSLKIDMIEAVEHDIYTLFGKKCHDQRDQRRALQHKLAVQLGIIKNQTKDSRHLPIIVPSNTPDSDEDVEQDFVVSYNTIVDRSENVMNDVRKEFSEITFVKEQFEKWKLQEGDSYKNAYITQCLPLVFSPLIRLEMLGWNPLQPSCPNFEEYSWFLSLMTYGFQEGHDPKVEDPDTNMIPIIVSKVLVPKITKLVERCWDPFSTKQTQRLVTLVTLLFEDYIPKDTKYPEVNKLIASIQNEIEQLIIHEAFLPFTADRSSNLDSKVERYLTFQYGKCIKILKNILIWNNVISSDLVFKLSVDSLLNRHIVAFLQTSQNYLDCVDKIDMIIKVLPVSWFERTDKLLPQLNSFAMYLTSLSQIIDRKLGACSTDIDKKTHKTALRKVMSMLLRINGMDFVRNNR